MLVMKEESFGPIIGIMKVKNDEEAIQLMQDTEYGLTASVYSTDKQTAENILWQDQYRYRILELLRPGFCFLTLEWQKTFRIWCGAIPCRTAIFCSSQGMAYAGRSLKNYPAKL